MVNKEKILSFYRSHFGEVNGALAGLIISVIILLIGFFKTLFIVICVLVGYYIGKKISDDKEYIKNFLDRILPPGTYR
ncbi:UNVERIFIED_CONTAM: putative membrane protein [Acetivibrio alkalicellulosi]